MKKINELAQLFARYKIYPRNCYNSRSPAMVFQRMFPENHYSKDLKTFLSYQDYKPTQRGADLPWWGKSFFLRNSGFRTLIIGQDSTYEDAGSIVLAAEFFPNVSREKYQEFIDEMEVNRYFGFNKWERVRDQFVDWGIDFDFLYITDASKVYKEGSWNNWNFDRKKSRELLENEIEFCNPDLIILLGTSPLYLLDNTINYASAVGSGKLISVLKRSCVVAPFFLGNGRAQSSFRKRLDIATDLIRKKDT